MNRFGKQVPANLKWLFYHRVAYVEQKFEHDVHHRRLPTGQHRLLLYRAR